MNCNHHFLIRLYRIFAIRMEFEIHHIERVDSTNRYAFEFCTREEIAEGIVYLAREQYAGKGYHQNSWLSEKGKNLTFSLVLRPEFIPPSDQFVLTQIISLALTDLLNSLIARQKICIKWPNDIYVDDRKICGILVQNSIMGDKIDFSVVGIGLNVNQTVFPEELPNPVSIAEITGEVYNPNMILKQLLECIGERYERYKDNPNRDDLQREYLDNLYRYGQPAEFKDDTGFFIGQITGVDEYGRLELMLSGGERKKYNFKEVEFETDD
jgi:BirA family biotin operon repressor/biotin-[acetyl-CoA-carboxylase] ligase